MRSSSLSGKGLYRISSDSRADAFTRGADTPAGVDDWFAVLYKLPIASVRCLKRRARQLLTGLPSVEEQGWRQGRS